MKINPTFSLFSALILAFIFGFSLSSNFNFPYETNQSSNVLANNEQIIIENEENLVSVTSSQIHEDFNNIDAEDMWKTSDIEENSKKKLIEKNCDWIIANDVSNKSIGFNSDFNEVTVFYKNKEIEKIPKMSKTLIAEKIIERVISKIN